MGIFGLYLVLGVGGLLLTLLSGKVLESSKLDPQWGYEEQEMRKNPTYRFWNKASWFGVAAMFAAVGLALATYLLSAPA